MRNLVRAQVDDLYGASAGVAEASGMTGAVCTGLCSLYGVCRSCKSQYAPALARWCLH